MNSYPLAKARSSLSKLVDQALAGEPQRITRHGKEAVVVVSEADWEARQQKPQEKRETLADLLLRTMSTEAAEAIGSEKWATDDRELGRDFTD